MATVTAEFTPDEQDALLGATLRLFNLTNEFLHAVEGQEKAETLISQFTGMVDAWERVGDSLIGTNPIRAMMVLVANE